MKNYGIQFDETLYECPLEIVEPVGKNKLDVLQNTFSYIIKIVPLFPFQILITSVTVSRMR